jgi:hypothetical protein
MTITSTTRYATAQRWPAGQVGEVTVSPRTPTVAGEHGSWTYRYVTGEYGVDDGGGLLLLFSLPDDRGRPQFDDPEGPDYCTVTTSGRATVTPRFAAKLHQRPWPSGIAVDVTDGPLAPGDVVEIHLGDRSGGSPGARTQSFVDVAGRVRVMVDPFATGVFYDVPGDVGIPVVAGPAVALVAVADSQALPGDQIRLSVRAVDRYGNVATSYTGTVSVQLDGAEVAAQETGTSHAGICSLRVTAPEPGVHRFEAHDAEAGLSAVANPVLVTATATPLRLLWGDTQGQTGESVGTGTLESFLDYARDAARLDFVTHSANDFQVESEFYAAVWDAVDRYTVDDRFVAFGGFEWSGNTPTGGDHNVLYAHRDAAPLMRSSHALLEDHSDLETDRRTVTDLNRTLREEDIDAVCVAHVGGRVVDLDLVETDTTPVLEIVSVHGWFEWLALEALQKGLEVGFVGASDDHSGRPGASYPSQPSFGVRSGLAAVSATELSRTGVLDALRARHTYATTGERIHLQVRSGEHTMGDKFDAAAPVTIDVTVAGTAGIEAVDLMGADGALQTWQPEAEISRRRLRVAWRGARHRYRGRTQAWDGHLRVTGARIVAARTWAFDHPDQGITSQDESTVSWASSTNGDHDGVELELDAEPTSLHFTGGDMDCVFDLSRLTDTGCLEVDSPEGLDRAVTVRRLPASDLPLQAETTFTVTDLAPGTHPYFVRIRQSDGHLAWSSPMFVRASDPPAL